MRPWWITGFRAIFVALMIYDVNHGYRATVYASVVFLWALSEYVGWSVRRTRQRERWSARRRARPDWTEL